MNRARGHKALLIMLGLLLTLPIDTIAGTIVFNDVTPDPLSISVNLGRSFSNTPFCVPTESCFFVDAGPTGSHHTLTQQLGFAFSDPGTDVLSDSLRIGPYVNAPAQVLISFGSVPDSFGPFSCATFSGFVCVGPEDGTVQSVFTINWFNDAGALVAADTVSFQSVEAPEPSTMPLMITGLLLLSILVWLGFHRTQLS